MIRIKLMPLALLLGCVLLATAAAAAAATPASTDQPAVTSANLIRTTLQADLTFKSTLSPELLPPLAFHQKTCRCSCGFPCNQDDDCGPGGKCEQFISCCGRGEQSQLPSLGKSTRTGEEPVVSVKCK